MNITEPIRHLARLTSDAVAIVRADDSEISYGALEHAINRMATHAARLGLRAGDIAGLAITGPDESLGFILALALARIGVAAADPSLSPERLRLCFQAARTGRSIEPGKVRFDAAWMPGQPPGPNDPIVEMHADPATLCIVFTTSGTTGLPKHVPVSHALMVRRVHIGLLGLADRRATRIIGVGLAGTMGFTAALRTLWLGGTLVLTNPVDAAAAIERHGVTAISASPAAMSAMLESLPPDIGPFPTLEAVEVAGGVLAAPLRRMIAARICPRITVYLGSSEASGIASAPVKLLASRPGAVGYVWPGVQVQAMDAQYQPLPMGEEGILRVRGDEIAEGYLDDDAETAKRFRDGWFWSGDIGAVWPDGMVTLAGRASEVINSGGVKVSPHLIEEALLSLPTVIDAAAFAVPDASGIDQIWAAIVTRVHIDDAVLNSFCRHALRGMSPKTILQMKALPRNENGKLMREQLVQLATRMNAP